MRCCPECGGKTTTGHSVERCIKCTKCTKCSWWSPILGPEPDFAAYALPLPKLPPLPEDATTKPTNPKDAIGSDKIPMHLWPETATALGAMALLDGALKYGRANWRVAGVRASIYVDALRRHVAAWFEGEDNDPDSGLSHLAHALACLAILVDARAAGKMTDDRQVRGGYRDMLTVLTPEVREAKKRHADKAPKHYTIADNGADI